MMWCAVLVALAVLIWPGNKSGRLYRLAYRGRAVDSAAINDLDMPAHLAWALRR